MLFTHKTPAFEHVSEGGLEVEQGSEDVVGDDVKDVVGDVLDESGVVKDVLDEPEDVKDVLDEPEVVEDVMGAVLDEPQLLRTTWGTSRMSSGLSKTSSQSKASWGTSLVTWSSARMQRTQLEIWLVCWRVRISSVRFLWQGWDGEIVFVHTGDARQHQVDHSPGRAR